jgi:aminoglycoside phosphotransferase (APT) family kinase protein
VVSPAAEIEVDERLVRALLAEQHPDLVDLPLLQVGAGWDNTLWRLGDGLLVRLPRRAMAAALTINEQRWLPELAPRLPLPIPVPLRVGRPSEDYPWSWSVVRWLDGRPGDGTPITEPEESARRLGCFLRALHHKAPSDAPQNPYRGVRLADRAPAVETRLEELAGAVDVQATRRVWDWALGAEPWSKPPVWIHGDLHPANILVEGGALAAVIDFGDLCAGDPATDLAGAWMLLPASALATFTTTYGDVDPELERRALGWVIAFALMLVAIGLDGRPSYEAVGRSALAKASERVEGVST